MFLFRKNTFFLILRNRRKKIFYFFCSPPQKYNFRPFLPTLSTKPFVPHHPPADSRNPAASSAKSGGRRRARGDGDAGIQSHKFLKYLQNKAIPSEKILSSSSERQCAYFISSKAAIIFWMAAFHSRISFNPSGCPCLSKSRNVTRRGAISRANVFSVFHTSSIGKSCLWLQFVVPSPFFFFIF